MANSFSGGRSRSTRREQPTMGKQLVNLITCGCESSAPFFCNVQSWVRSHAVLLIGLNELLGKICSENSWSQPITQGCIEYTSDMPPVITYFIRWSSNLEKYWNLLHINLPIIFPCKRNHFWPPRSLDICTHKSLVIDIIQRIVNYFFPFRFGNGPLITTIFRIFKKQS